MIQCPHCTNKDTRLMTPGGVDLKTGTQMLICDVCSKKFEYKPEGNKK